MDIKPFIKKYAFALIAVSVIWLATLLLALRLGVEVGSRRSEFACRWSENYRRNFGGPFPEGSGRATGREQAPSPHGVFGRVIGAATGTLVIKRDGGVETTVLSDNDTMIELFHRRVPFEEIRVGGTVVVIGQPDAQGRIRAAFIRLLPPPPATNP